MAPILLTAILLAGTGHCVADARRSYPAIYVLKPLTVVLIIALALLEGASGGPYRALVLGGLVFSLAGDIALMLRRRRFAAGLAFFLAAHLFYSAACFRPPHPLLLFPAACLALYGVSLYRLLRPGTGRLAPAVLLYLAALLVMFLAAMNRWYLEPALRTGMTAAGALLFVVSDSALAVRQFRREFRGSQVLVLATYYAAQCCIALG